MVSIPLLLLQLIIVFFLLLGILGRGDTIVNDFKGAVPLKYRSITNRFLDHLNPIYYSFFVIYFALAIICGILAAIIYGLLGVPFFVTFAVFIVFVGLIPSIGRALIYVPLALWLIIQGNTITGLIVLIVSIVLFEGILRYTIQPRWMERTGRVPRPLTLIAFTFALVAFGVIGFAIGPRSSASPLPCGELGRISRKSRKNKRPPSHRRAGRENNLDVLVANYF